MTSNPRTIALQAMMERQQLKDGQSLEPIEIDDTTEIVSNFVSSIINGMKPLEGELQKIVDSNFWSLIETK
jgi:hypothetical protein